jgi:glycosyltransferase involved in cell wall biosynthesis
MNVLHLSDSDSGGAGRAAIRLHRGLRELNINSQILVQYKFGEERAVLAPQSKLEKVVSKLKLIEQLDDLPLQFYRQHKSTDFSLGWFPDFIAPKVTQHKPDIINLHWVCHGYLKIETLKKFEQPLVWTLHDMWAFTGGCNYSQECDRYTKSCGECPILNSDRNWDLSRWVWQRKAKAWKNVNLTLVTPSRWLAKCASSSSLFQDKRVEVIPNSLDTQTYKPLQRQIARERLNLPQDKHLILFGAMYANSDRRKGFHLLQPALQSLSQSGWQDRIEIVVFGEPRSNQPLELGFKSHYLGKLSDDISLSLVYAAADGFVAPSLQDNLPNTVMEAIACGTPCVAFNIGGMPDLIEHCSNGYLAQPYEIEDLARGIAWVIENRERHQKLCDRARQKAEQEFTLEVQAHRYESLYRELLHSSRSA